MHRRFLAVSAIYLVFVIIIGAALAPHVLTQSKITICHFPPGNPANAQTIEVSTSALPVHQSHGDAIGACTAAGSG